MGGGDVLPPPVTGGGDVLLGGGDVLPLGGGEVLPLGGGGGLPLAGGGDGVVFGAFARRRRALPPPGPVLAPGRGVPVGFRPPAAARAARHVDGRGQRVPDGLEPPDRVRDCPLAGDDRGALAVEARRVLVAGGGGGAPVGGAGLPERGGEEVVGVLVDRADRLRDER